MLTWKTYDDWKLVGMQVRRGEKGSPSKRKDGKKLFSNKQVKPVSHRRWDDPGAGDYNYDEDDMIEDYIMDIGDR